MAIQQQMMPAPLAFLLARYRALGAAKATQTTGDIWTPFPPAPIKALLASQWGDYGLPPRESAFALHALVVGSYFRGAWFPQGGAGHRAHLRTGHRGKRGHDQDVRGSDGDHHPRRARGR